MLLKWLICAQMLLVSVFSKRIDTNPIVGGTQVSHNGMYPFMVGLYMKRDGRVFCGGSIIDPSFIVTAAHCLDHNTVNKIQDLRILAGTTDARNKDGQSRKVKTYKIHTSRFDNDIAVIELETPFVFSRNVQRILLSDKQKVPTGTLVYATGWGALFEKDKRETIRLKELKMKIGSDDTCSKELHISKDIPRNRKANDYSLICAEALDGNRNGICSGDSGGPLFYLDQSLQYRLAGVTSFSLTICEARNAWDFFMNVGLYTQWISQHTGISTSTLTGSVRAALGFRRNSNNNNNNNNRSNKKRKNNRKKKKTKNKKNKQKNADNDQNKLARKRSQNKTKTEGEWIV